MFFSIVISTYNRPSLLKLCLESIESAISKVNHLSIEVVVTDDSDNDDSLKMVQLNFPKFFYVTGKKKGPAANRNNGASKTVGEWIIFFDDDIIVQPDILIKYEEWISLSQAKVFEGAIYPDDFKLMRKDLSECPVNINGGCFWSANFCINSSVFIHMNGFDERFTIAAQEDQDIFIRIRKDFTISFAKDAIVIHPVRIVSLTKKIASIFQGVENWYLFETKHHKQSAKRFLKISLYLVYSHLRGSLLNLKNLKIKSAFFSFFWLLSGLPYYFILSIKNILYQKEVYE